jgi:RecA-family ATPase
MITCDIAARISTGREMPDGTFGDLWGPAGVVFLSAEDGLADTIRPRLDAAGADCTRVAALTFITEPDTGLMRAPSVADLHDLERAIAATDAKLVIIDPVVAYLPEKTKSHNDQDVRRVLAPLGELAERMHVAIWLLRHLNKAPGGNPLYRGGGSIAFIGAVRSGLLAAQDPEDETGERRIIAGTKSNLARASQALMYHIESQANGTAFVVWDGVSGQTATSLLTPIDPEDKSQLAEAVEFLKDLLHDGGMKAGDVQTKARGAGIATRTLNRAKAKLRIKSERKGAITDAYWEWVLPEAEEIS